MSYKPYCATQGIASIYQGKREEDPPHDMPAALLDLMAYTPPIQHYCSIRPPISLPIRHFYYTETAINFY